MKAKWVLVVALVCIIAVSWLDYQYLVEDHTMLRVTDNTRKFLHVFSYILVLAAGALAWRKISPTIYKIWLGAYVAGLLVYMLMGVLNRFVHFGDEFLNEVSRLRMFFCSPMPFGILFVFNLLLDKKNK